MNKEIVKLRQLFNECEKHKKRVERAHKNMSQFMPLDGVKFDLLTEDEIEHIDQYLYRFSKLQDTLGEKIFKTILLAVGENVKNKTFIDIFNRLEELEVIYDYEKWDMIRKLRNEIAHEYDDTSEEIAQKLNKIFYLKDDLINYYNAIKLFFEIKSRF